MTNRGVVSGVTETTFEPDREITRAEFAALVARALKLSGGDATFSDVHADDWFAASVTACASAGLMEGYQGAFRPDDTITRQEMAVVIVKAYERSGKAAREGTLSFTDNSQISDWAVPYVTKAVGIGLIAGMGNNTFAPEASATRAQTVTLIQKLMD